MFPIAILAGGLATRLRPLTEKIPKALIEVNHEPFINHQLRLLARAGFRQVVLCLGYLGEQVRQHIEQGNHFDLEVRYSFDGDKLLGTAGALRQALPLLGEHFFVIYGDSYLPCDFSAVQEAFIASHKPALMTVFHNAGQWDKSNVEFAHQHIIAYNKQQQTPRMQHIDYGVGVFNRQAFTLVPENEPYDLALLYQALLKENQLAAYEVHQRFYEVGSLAGIKELADYLAVTD